MRLYNTLTRRKEKFVPIREKEVSIYVCGPTVYNYIHVGNARPLVIFDTLRRYLKYKGYKVKFLVNFTDIDDKMIKKAKEEGKTVKEIADKFIAEYYKDSKGLLIEEEDTFHPKATDNIKEIVEFVQELINKGCAYNVEGNVYFDITKDKDYGKLSKKNIDELMCGARVEVSEEKHNPMDFALWKKAKEGEPYWETPWGKGRPGWHIESSAMAREFLGDTIDIHAGGEDLQFPHHENEIAQSETLTGKPFANYWLHNAMINVENVKMSKSKLNFFTVREIGQVVDLEVLRFFILQSHYRSPVNFNKELLLQAGNGLERLYNGKKNLEYLLNKCTTVEFNEKADSMKKAIDLFKEKFINSMEDDINTADSVSALFELIKWANTNLNENSLKNVVQYAYSTLMELANILGILSKKDEMLDNDITELIEKRTEARRNKDFKLADKIRDELKEKGIILEDTSEGVKWKRV